MAEQRNLLGFVRLLFQFEHVARIASLVL